MAFSGVRQEFEHIKTSIASDSKQLSILENIRNLYEKKAVISKDLIDCLSDKHAKALSRKLAKQVLVTLQSTPTESPHRYNGRRWQNWNGAYGKPEIRESSDIDVVDITGVDLIERLWCQPIRINEYLPMWRMTLYKYKLDKKNSPLLAWLLHELIDVFNPEFLSTVQTKIRYETMPTSQATTLQAQLQDALIRSVLKKDPKFCDAFLASTVSPIQRRKISLVLEMLSNWRSMGARPGVWSFPEDSIKKLLEQEEKLFRNLCLEAGEAGHQSLYDTAKLRADKIANTNIVALCGSLLIQDVSTKKNIVKESKEKDQQHDNEKKRNLSVVTKKQQRLEKEQVKEGVKEENAEFRVPAITAFGMHVEESKSVNDIQLAEKIETVHKLLATLDMYVANWEQFFPWFEQRPYQIKKVRMILEWFQQQITGEIIQKAIADITPPSGGKTFMMLLIAKMMFDNGIPTIIGMWNKTNIDGPDNGIATFEKIFGAANIWVVTGEKQVYDKPITLITAHSFPHHIEKFSQHKMVNIMFDEWDTFQTDLRQEAMRLFSPASSFMSMYSATKILNKRNITHWAHVVDEMSLLQLIRLGHAKNIVGSYYLGQITVTNENVKLWEVSFASLKEAEKQRLVDSAYAIFQLHPDQKHMIHCQNIEQCKLTVAKFKKQNIKAAYVTHKTDSSARKEIESQYIHGDSQVLISTGIYTRGFSDNWATSVEIFAKVSGSETEVYQTILRWSRPSAKHDILKIYQLLPSTIETKTFTPVLMHHCFHIPIDDVWYRLNDESEVLPISFTTQTSPDTEEKKLKTPTTPKQASQSASKDKTQLTFAYHDQVVDIINTKTFSEKMTEYVRENFFTLIDSVCKKYGCTIFTIAGAPRGDTIETVTIDGKEVDVTLNNIRSAVFTIVCWLPKEEEGNHSNIATSRLQERYVYGNPPLVEGINTLLDLKELNKKERKSFHKWFLDKHALEIFHCFMEQHNVTEERPDTFSTTSILYQDALQIKYGTFLYNALMAMTGCEFALAKRAPLLANKLMREWHSTDEKPSQEYARNRFLQWLFDKRQFFALYKEKIIDTFLSTYDLSREDIPYFAFTTTHSVTIPIDIEMAKEYLQKTDQTLLSFLPDTFSHSIDFEWRSLVRDLYASFFDGEYVKQHSIKWSDLKKYSSHTCPEVTHHILNGTLTREIVQKLMKQQWTDLPLDKDYAIVKHIDRIIKSNNHSIKAIFHWYLKKYDQKYTIELGTYKTRISLAELLSSFLSVIHPTIYTWKKIHKISSYNFDIYGLPLLATYIAIDTEKRSLYTPGSVEKYYSNCISPTSQGDNPLKILVDGVNLRAWLWPKKKLRTNSIMHTNTLSSTPAVVAISNAPITKKYFHPDIIESWLSTTTMPTPVLMVTNTSSMVEEATNQVNIVESIVTQQATTVLTNLGFISPQPIPTIADIAFCLSQLRASKKHHVDLASLQATIDPKARKIIHDYSEKHYTGEAEDVFVEEIQNKIIRSTYRAQKYDDLPTNDYLYQLILEDDFSALKESLLRLYTYCDKTISEKKRQNTYTRPVAQEVLQYKNIITALWYPYDKSNSVTVGVLSKITQDNLKTIAETLTLLAADVGII